MSTDRFLLIKAWSYNLCGDIDHVLGQLLIAELTDRIPVVYWPTHYMNNGFIQTNGFELYFEPVSNKTVFDLVKNDYTYYPPIWDSDNLLMDDQTKDTWTFRNIGELLSSNANVVIGDVYYNIYELLPFIRKNHPAYGMTVEQAYHYLLNRYLRLKPDIELEIQGYYNSWIKNRHPVLAVHVRRVEEKLVFSTKDADRFDNQYWNKFYIKYKNESGKLKQKTYKITRRSKYKEPNKAYHKEIQKYIEKYNIRKIFLLTDSQEVVREYGKIYGQMLIYTNCRRLAADDDENLMENPMIKRNRGIEVLKDAYVASKCDFFIGNDFSNLSHFVTRMKDWPDKSVRLLYWLYKKRKYPINAKLIIKDSKNIFKKLIKKVKQLFTRRSKLLADGGVPDAG